MFDNVVDKKSIINIETNIFYANFLYIIPLYKHSFYVGALKKKLLQINSKVIIYYNFQFTS